MHRTPATAASAYRRSQRSLAFIGFLCLFVGLRFFLDPATAEVTAVGRVSAGIVDDLWSACFLVGGAGVIYGTQRPDLRVERSALILLAAALALNGGVILYAFHSLPATLAVIPHAVLVAVFAERIHLLTKLDRLTASRAEGAP